MSDRIAILGAGAIGCFVGAEWAAAGRVTLIGRSSIIDGLRRTDLTLEGSAPPAGTPALSTDPSAMVATDAVVFAMKAPALADAMEEVAAHAPPEAVLVSLLNGLEPVRRLRARFPDRTVLAGMVPFNVVWDGPNRLRRTGPGTVALERHPLTERLARSGAPVELWDDLRPTQHGKLLLNLANAVNALSGRPLRSMLMDRDYRRVFAASLAEALNVYHAAGIEWRKVGATSPRIAVPMLRAPTWLFDRVVLRKQGLDPRSMTSMAADLAAARPTEIDTINGEICRLGTQTGTATPVNDRLIELVRAVETGTRAGALSPKALLREVGL